MGGGPVLTMVQATAESDNGTHGPIKHTIILYQENISFDHYFGTYGNGSNGIPAGSTLSYTNGISTWGPYSPTPLSGLTQSRTCDVDPTHTDMIRIGHHRPMDAFLSPFPPPAPGHHKPLPDPSPS